jgi:hypothetical protein
MLRFAMMLAAVILGSSPVLGQSPATQPSGSFAEPTSAPQLSVDDDADALTDAEIGENEREWEFSATALIYIVPDDRDYVQPTLTIDRDWLHLEARYNYEDLDTASIWIGYNFSVGDTLTLDFTPMVGGVFGDTRGAAPGYEITLAWRAFELYTEGEYVVDADDSSDNFFYSWSELTYSPTAWVRAGMAVQRTKIRAESSDFEIGPMIGVTYECLDFSAYLLFPEEGDPTVALGVGIDF